MNGTLKFLIVAAVIVVLSPLIFFALAFAATATMIFGIAVS